MKIRYLIGDATKPVGGGTKMIVHCCNNLGRWGSGFVLALTKRWPHTKAAYKYWFADSGPKGFDPNEKLVYRGALLGREYGMSGRFELGQIQWVKAEDTTFVVNMIGQHRTGIKEIAGVKIIPVDYRSFVEGFARIKELFQSSKNPKGFSLHMPRIGCGLAGGSWDKVEECLQTVFGDTDINIYVYDFEG